MVGERDRKGITVIAGPARSGKTGRVVALFAAARSRGERAQVIVPDEAAARSLKRRLLELLPALEGECVTTFPAIALRVAAASGADVRPASAYSREIILREAAEALSGEGRLERLSAITDFPGFYGDLESFLRQLKAACISPKAFAERAANGSVVDKELALLYGRYEAGLSDKGLVDGEGLLRLAAEALAQACPFRAPAFLGVDGFSHFSRLQFQLLRAYAAYVPSVAVTLPLEPGARAELFERTADTLKRIESFFGVRIERMAAVEAKGAAGHIAAAFLSQERAQKAEAGGGLRVITTAGARMEADEIAREAKRLIREGRRPRDIAIAVRDEATYGPLLAEAFSRMGVPLDARTALVPETAAVFALPRLLVEVAETDFAREPVVRLLTSSYVDVRRLAGGTLTPSDVMRIAREAAVLKGSKQWRTRLEAYKRRTESAADAAEMFEDEEKPNLPPVDATRVDMLRAAVDHLAASLAPLRRAAMPAVFAGHFKRLLDELGVRGRVLDASAPEEVVFRDLAAYGALVDALDYLEAADGGVVTGAGAFLEMVKRVVRASGASCGSLRNGGVALVEAERLGASYPIVFLCGVSSKAYPARPKAGPFHCREDKEGMAADGLCDSEAAHLASERLVFYGAATRAQETLYLTYPATDEAGKPGLASFYLDELETLFSDWKQGCVRYGPMRPLMLLDGAACAREATLAAGARIRGAATREEAEKAAAGALAIDAGFAGALRGAAVEARRESQGCYDRFDLALSSRAAAAVARHFSNRRPWSPSELSDYGHCPALFFLSRVARAERPEEPGATPAPAVRGSLAHRALAGTFRTIVEKGLVSMLWRDKALEALEPLLDEAAARVYAAYEKREGLGGDPFWEVERQRHHRMLKRFFADELERIRKDAAGARHMPALFELSFGVAAFSPEDEIDGASAPRPLAVERDGRMELIRGIIDRVDLANDSWEGPRPATILDYKLSRAPTGREVREFVDMQMAAYLYAAAQVVPEEGGVLPARAIFRSIRTCKGREPCIKFGDMKDYEAFRGMFAEALFGRADAVRKGEFAPRPAGDCAPYCMGRGVCRYSEARAELLEHKQ